MATNVSGNASSAEVHFAGALTYPALQAFLTYSIPAVVLLGLFGNTVAFVLLKNSALRSTAHFYLCALTLCDSLTLLSILASVWSGVLLSGHLHQMGWHGTWLHTGLRQIHLCRARLYVTFVCRTVSTWIVAAFSWERCLAVWRPMRFEGAAVGWRSGLVLLGLVAAAAGANAYVIPGYQPDHRGLCRAGQLFRVGRNASMLLHSLAPWLLVLTSNCLIACSLRRRQAAAEAATTGEGASAADCGPVLLRGQQPRLELRQLRHHRRRRGVTYRLVAVSFAFLVSTSLLTICTVWMTIAELVEARRGAVGERNLVRDTAWLVSFLPFTINFASTCPLYCLAGRKFRRAARLLVTCQLERMRLARRLLDPSRPSSGLTAAAATAAAAATTSSMRPSSDQCMITANSRRQQKLLVLQQQDLKRSSSSASERLRRPEQLKQQQSCPKFSDKTNEALECQAEQLIQLKPLQPTEQATQLQDVVVGNQIAISARHTS